MKNTLESIINELTIENEVLKKQVKLHEDRVKLLKSCLPKLQHFNQQQRVRKEAFKYALKIMSGKLDEQITS